MVVAAHLFGVVHHHLVVQVLDLLHRVDIVQLLDVKITHPKACSSSMPYCLHIRVTMAVVTTKWYFKLVTGSLDRDPHPVGVHKAVLIAVLAHCVHFTVGHGAVKQELFAGLAVFRFVNVVVGFDHEPFVLVAHPSFLLPLFSSDDIHYSMRRRFPQGFFLAAQESGQEFDRKNRIIV